MADVMTGVPSIVMGLFIFSIWTLHFGFSGFGGSLALACLMLPHRDPLQRGDAEAGAKRAARGQLRPGGHQDPRDPHRRAARRAGRHRERGLLAVARAAGETAPLLFTILTVTEPNRNVFQRRQHGAGDADLRQCDAAVRRAPQARAWGAALTLDCDRLYPHDRGADHHRTIHPSGDRKDMEQSDDNVITQRQPGGPRPLRPHQPEPSPSGDPVFDAESVSIYYGAFRAVTDVSLSIYKNEITAFIGPSGCGKTTVLRTLNRMNDLVAGRSRRGRRALPRRVPLRPGRLPDRGATSDRHGLPEAEPVSEVDLRQRRLRTAHQRRAAIGTSWTRSSNTRCARPRCGTR